MKRSETHLTFAQGAFLSPDEAAALLGVQRRTLMAWARRGEVPHVVLKWGKDGRASVVRFSEKRLREWIEEKEQPVSMSKDHRNVV